MRASLTLLVLTAACAGRRPAAVPSADPEPRAAATVDERPAPADDAAPGKPVIQRSLLAIGLDPDALDRTADPCDDFYQFACGGWIKRIEIAADRPMAMRSFIDIEDRNLAYEHDMLEQARVRPDDDPVARQLGTFYGSCMDEAAIDKAGLSPLRPLLAAIDRVKDARSLTAALAMLDAAGFPGLFVISPVQDPGDARRVIARLDQGGLGLPDRDYYLSDDDQTRGVRSSYQNYVDSVLAAIGHRSPSGSTRQAAAEVVALETEIARISRDKAARRDPRASYHRIDRAGLVRAMPRLDWDAYWSAIGLRRVDDVTVSSLELLAGLDRLLAATRPEAWRAYLAFHVTDEAAPLLTEQLADAQFTFLSALTGQPEQSPRWKRCVVQTTSALGDLVGQAFVRDRFAGPRRAMAEDQIHAIAAATAADLDALPWMDDVTRARAHAKLDALTYQIGYPDRWRTYHLKLDARTWAANALAARRAERARQLARIGKPIDKDSWRVTATQARAYYDRRLNSLVVPAGILQPPLYSGTAAVPVNLGGIGVVVGHELTHGFDDQGAEYDVDGNLVNWWQADTEQQYRERTRCVIDQYNRYEVGGDRLSGTATAHEDIADIGGVKLAFAAYHGLRSAAPSAVVADGFTEDQQFFLGFGQAWCAKLRPDFDRMSAAADVHAPARWRVDGALSATPEFARAFHCKAGSKMVPARQCVVW
jgi:putative endopeptidase